MGRGEFDILFYFGCIVTHHDFLQFHYVPVLTILQNLDLSQARDRQAVAVVGFDLQPLERHHLASRQLPGPRDPAVGTLLDVVELVVVLHAPRVAEAAPLQPQQF